MKCKGLLGWLFGHKFKITDIDLVWPTNFCTRCGYRP